MARKVLPYAYQPRVPVPMGYLLGCLVLLPGLYWILWDSLGIYLHPHWVVYVPAPILVVSSLLFLSPWLRLRKMGMGITIDQTGLHLRVGEICHDVPGRVIKKVERMPVVFVFGVKKYGGWGAKSRRKQAGSPCFGGDGALVDTVDGRAAYRWVIVPTEDLLVVTCRGGIRIVLPSDGGELDRAVASLCGRGTPQAVEWHPLAGGRQRLEGRCRSAGRLVGGKVYAGRQSLCKSLRRGRTHLVSTCWSAVCGLGEASQELEIQGGKAGLWIRGRVGSLKTRVQLSRAQKRHSRAMLNLAKDNPARMGYFVVNAPHLKISLRDTAQYPL